MGREGCGVKRRGDQERCRWMLLRQRHNQRRPEAAAGEVPVPTGNRSARCLGKWRWNWPGFTACELSSSPPAPGISFPGVKSP